MSAVLKKCTVHLGSFNSNATSCSHLSSSDAHSLSGKRSSATISDTPTGENCDREYAPPAPAPVPAPATDFSVVAGSERNSCSSSLRTATRPNDDDDDDAAAVLVSADPAVASDERGARTAATIALNTPRALTPLSTASSDAFASAATRPCSACWRATASASFHTERGGKTKRPDEAAVEIRHKTIE